MQSAQPSRTAYAMAGNTDAESRRRPSPRRAKRFALGERDNGTAAAAAADRRKSGQCRRRRGASSVARPGRRTQETTPTAGSVDGRPVLRSWLRRLARRHGDSCTARRSPPPSGDVSAAHPARRRSRRCRRSAGRGGRAAGRRSACGTYRRGGGAPRAVLSMTAPAAGAVAGGRVGSAGSPGPAWAQPAPAVAPRPQASTSRAATATVSFFIFPMQFLPSFRSTNGRGGEANSEDRYRAAAGSKQCAFDGHRRRRGKHAGSRADRSIDRPRSAGHDRRCGPSIGMPKAPEALARPSTALRDVCGRKRRCCHPGRAAGFRNAGARGIASPLLHFAGGAELRDWLRYEGRPVRHRRTGASDRTGCSRHVGGGSGTMTPPHPAAARSGAQR